MSKLNSRKRLSHKILVWVLFNLYTLMSNAQVQPIPTQDSTDKMRVEIINTDILNFEKRGDQAVKKLIGNVHLIQDSTVFYCDSAYHFETENRLEAYDNVKVVMSDSVQLEGDKLEYDMNTRIAEIYDNITLTNGDTRLFTDRLTYYRNESFGYYSEGGTLEDTANTLTSIYGYYYPNQDEAFFKEQVILVNPEYVLETDTLGYQTETRVATFLSPTLITSDRGEIQTNKGYYDTLNEKIRLYNRASVADSTYTLFADSLDYDSGTELGYAFGEVVLEQADSSMKVVGDYGWFNRQSNESFITDNAVAIQFMESDTLYMFADTLFSMEDSMGNRTFRAYHEVSFYMGEMQGVADSMVYQYQDSNIVLYRKPAIWSDESQITGDTIFIQMKNNEPDSMWIGKNGFMVSREDTVGFNQVKGKEIRAKFKDQELAQLHVIGNSESIYFSKNEEGNYEGMNQALSQEMVFLFRDNTAYRIIFLANPEGKFKPIFEVLFEENKLEGMSWRIDERPVQPPLNEEGIPSPRVPVFHASQIKIQPDSLQEKEVPVLKSEELKP